MAMLRDWQPGTPCRPGATHRQPHRSGAAGPGGDLPGGARVKTFIQLLRVGFWMLPFQRWLTVLGGALCLVSLMFDLPSGMPASSLPITFLGVAIMVATPLFAGGHLLPHAVRAARSAVAAAWQGAVAGWHDWRGNAGNVDLDTGLLGRIPARASEVPAGLRGLHDDVRADAEFCDAVFHRQLRCQPWTDLGAGCSRCLAGARPRPQSCWA